VTPTTRSAGLLAAVAVAGLALPIWAAVAGALVVLMATLVDGLSVRDAPHVERRLQEVLSRGVAAGLEVQALPRDARRVLLRQPATPALEVRARGGARELRGEIMPVARGRHSLPGVAGASVGPLGLARWHHAEGEATEVLVYPDLLTARRLALRLRQGRAAPDGRLRRGPLGLGTEFESIREYSPDDDIRQVNWRASARLGRPMSNQYRVEQDHDVVCLLDAGRLMAAPLERGTLLDAALDAATATALVADELGDRFGAIAFDASVRREIQPRRQGGRRAVRALFDLQPTLEDSDFERAFLRVGSSRRGLVLVLTDLIDEQAARSLVRAAPMLTRRHAVLVASVSDPALDAASDRRGDPAGAIAALSVLRARDGAVARIRRAGANVVLAPAGALPERCVQAYLRAKARARL
jgi:uncharacterized protein (DUF58 family)